MNAASVDRTHWTIGNGDRPPAMEIVLVKTTLVLSWNQFIFAEGDDDEIHIAFASHDVIVRGAGLSVLLQAVTTNRVSSIREPGRADRFATNAARLIREIEVRRIDAD
jgi:hypothetical protein